MKTLYRTYNIGQAKKKRAELQEKTGLKWDTYAVGDGIRFSAVVTRDTVEDEKAGLELEKYLDGIGYSFVKLAKVSGMPLADVLSGAKWLARQGRMTAGVNRCGNFATIYKSSYHKRN